MTTPSPSSGDRLDPRIAQYLAQRRANDGGSFAAPAATPTVVSLTGDASDRRYFRVIHSDGGSQVLALHAGPIELASLPFANVAALMTEMALPIPAILGHSDPLGIVELDDLGDVTLQAHLRVAAPGERAALYREAVDLIERLQRQGAAIDGERYLPYRLAFDVEKLTWELDFFVKHFIEGYRGAPVSASQRDALGDEFHAVAAELSSEPRVLCHRDYHSRNLMHHAGRLSIIDFQDARMGPDTYDLVSLLRDSYVDLDPREVDDLIAYYLGVKGGTASYAADFRRRFDLMSVQRNLKALGTFGYQTIVRKSDAYTADMPRTLRFVRENLHRYPRFARLGELLAGLIVELR